VTAPNVSVTVDVGPATTLLDRINRSLTDLTPVLAGPVNKTIDDFFKAQFDTEGSFGGQRWATLAPVTLILRQRRGHGRGGILRDTGRLWASLVKLGLGPDAIKVVTANSLVRGTRVPYAKFHQTGYTAKTFVVVDRRGNPIPLYRKRPHRVPARVIVPGRLPTVVSDKIAKTILAFIGGKNAA